MVFPPRRYARVYEGNRILALDEFKSIAAGGIINSERPFMDLNQVRQ